MWFWEHTIIAQILSIIMCRSLTQIVCEIFDHAHFHDVIIAMNATRARDDYQATGKAPEEKISNCLHPSTVQSRLSEL